MPGLAQMWSVSSGGASVITLRFDLLLPLDVAEQEVQASMNAASSFLPSDLPSPPIYAKVNPADAPVITLGVTSATLPLTQLYDLADTRLSQKLSQVPGVGMVTLSGGHKPAVSVSVNARALAALGLSLDNIRTAIAGANVNTPKGSIDGPQRSFTIDANDQLQSPEAYRDMIIAYKSGAPVRLGDVATVEEAPENAWQAAWVNGKPGLVLNVQRQPGANVIQVVDRIHELLPDLQKSLPGAAQLTVLSDRTVTIRAAIADVRFELLLAVVLVVAVIFVFLRNARATFIPATAVPLALIGTFGVMYLAGYSINTLTLMALTIATGFVVDDAIVMIENIARYIEAGEPPLQAALKGAGQIGFTIISLTFSLIAVLIPLLFMGDVVGRLFREFAITLAVAIVISAAVSLTFTPMLSARMLRHIPEEKQGRFSRASGRAFERLADRYSRALVWVLRHQPTVLVVALLTLLVTVALYVVIPKGFFPVQDTGLRVKPTWHVCLVGNDPKTPVIDSNCAPNHHAGWPAAQFTRFWHDSGQNPLVLVGVVVGVEEFFVGKHDGFGLDTVAPDAVAKGQTTSVVRNACGRNAGPTAALEAQGHKVVDNGPFRDLDPVLEQ